VVRAKARNDVLIEANRALEDAVEKRTSSLRAAKKELERLRDAYKQLSEIDELTGLGNRRKFDLELGRGLALANRLNLPLSLMMLDIDYFKAVNDRQGHQVGDEYLAAIGRVLAAAVRKGEDVATRFGGEEFALLLSNTGMGGAQILAERIRADIEALRLPNSGSPNEIVTVSIGIAALDPGAAAGTDTLVGRADRALYRAKQAGRNRVIAEG
jgi:diguanylate cyclase (GGDEF)-like protein